MTTSSFLYQAFYCEENAWQLCASPELAGREAYAVFISNLSGQVILLHQRAGESVVDPVIWDYHVVVVAQGDAGDWMIWDLDSHLGPAMTASSYLHVTFALALYMPQRLAPLFRLVPSEVYRRELCTDRRHMRLPDGSYRSPPPPWPEIGEGSNLLRFVDMQDEFLGEVVDFEEMLRRFGTS